ncbi:DUF2752 domain-containing protein [Flavobacterium sp. I3-2]|uniref:DUF2752 domain-containing protein n=1 Tax=Flavobacterium sp. I3-2 TaxID=2748319 RepID=UPI0015A95A82
MIKSRNKLYFFIFTACIFSYIWLIYNFINIKKEAGITVCHFKNLTSLPCPSCGSTRSVLSILKGNLPEAFVINPLGFIIFLILMIIPIWILYDFVLKKESFFNFYKAFEKKMSKPKFYIPAIILLVLNWIWNINKQL